MDYLFPERNHNNELVDILQKINTSLEHIHTDQIEIINTLRSIDNHIAEKTEKTEKALVEIRKEVSDLALSSRLSKYH